MYNSSYSFINLTMKMIFASNLSANGQFLPPRAFPFEAEIGTSCWIIAIDFNYEWMKSSIYCLWLSLSSITKFSCVLITFEDLLFYLPGDFDFDDSKLLPLENDLFYGLLFLLTADLFSQVPDLNSEVHIWFCFFAIVHCFVSSIFESDDSSTVIFFPNELLYVELLSKKCDP